ncbi:MAG: T9SS type A sorting domain-containing protein [Candidatus Zixiibacteriota bacterium]|nr:MAG: T9SS type A sorting domain-containing protein [candidate division Zixibacteria bacterium]
MFRTAAISILVVSLFPRVLPADPPDTVWTRTFGGTANDMVVSAYETPDGGIVIGGSTSSIIPGDYQFWLIKTDLNGDTLWARDYGDEDMSESASWMCPTDDGGFILAGAKEVSILDTDAYILKTDSAGIYEWATLIGADDIDETCSWIEQTSDGGYVVCGYFWAPNTGFDFYIARLNMYGIVQWTQVYDWFNGDYARCVEETNDGGFIVTGYTSSTPDYFQKIFILKTAANGDSIWARRYGGADDDKGYHITQTSDNGYIVTGNTMSFGAGGRDFWILKTDENGDTLWTATYGDTYHDAGTYAMELADGGYVVTGSGRGINNFDLLLLKYDQYGSYQWTGIYGGSGSDNAYCIQQTVDGGFLLAGSTNSFGAGEIDGYVVRLYPEPMISVEEPVNRLPRSIKLSQNYPNPFNASTMISFELSESGNVILAVYDLLGREMETLADGYLDIGGYSIDFDASDLTSGVYFYRLQIGGVVETKRMVLLK